MGLFRRYAVGGSRFAVVPATTQRPRENAAARSIIWGEFWPQIAGVGASTLAVIVAVGAAGAGVSGTGASTLGAFGSAGVAKHGIGATGASTLGAVVCTGAANHLAPGGTGTGASTLSPVVSVGVAGRGATASGASTLSVIGTGTATHSTASQGASALGPVTCVGVALFGAVDGSGASTLGPIVCAGQAGSGVSLSGALLLGPVVSRSAVTVGSVRFTAPGTATLATLVGGIAETTCQQLGHNVVTAFTQSTGLDCVLLPTNIEVHEV